MHKDALSDGLMTFVGGLAAEDLDRGDCPDLMHTEDAPEEWGWVETNEPIGGGWVATGHYECPTCGFSSAGRRMSDPSDPVTRDVVQAIRDFATPLD